MLTGCASLDWLPSARDSEESPQQCEDVTMCLQTAQANLFQEDRDDVDDLCIVCWEKVREVIFYHCMHMVRSHGLHLLHMLPLCGHGLLCLPR